MANPYDFVTFAEVNRKNLDTSTGHRQFHSTVYSGVVKCSLITQSPFSIKNLYEELYQAQVPEVFIPGSSIKGMFRTTMEALYGGCGFKIERNYYYDDRTFTHPKDKYEFKIFFDVRDCFFPDQKFAQGTSDELSRYSNCSRRINEALKQMSESERKAKTIQDFPLCPICSLFGLTADAGISYAGRLAFEDSCKTSAELQRIELPRPDQPRVYRRGFYFKNPSSLPEYTETPADNGNDKFRIYAGGEYNGRKFYLHSQNGEVTPPDPQRDDNQPVYAVPSQTKFTFQICFTNLADDELGMLLFALQLEAGICHKLGYGKPWGMGSVKIEPKTLTIRTQSAYTDFAADSFQDGSANISERIENFKKLYKERFGVEITQTSHFKKLHEIWNCEGQFLRYPKLKEFFGKKQFDNWTIQQFNEWWEKRNAPKSTKAKTPPKQSKPQPKAKAEVKLKPKPTEDILELSITKIERNQPFVTVDGEEIKVSGWVPNAKVGVMVRGFITTKKDGRREFIRRTKKD